MRKARRQDNAGLSREEATVRFARSGYDLDLHPAHLVRRAHQRATQHFQQVMEGDNLSPTQFAALATILKHGAISQNHLGRMTSMDPSTISVVVRKLIKDGFVKRKSSTTDQRLTILVLTDAGQEFTLPRLALSSEVGRRLLAPLDPQEQAVFLALLTRICAEDAGAGNDADETSDRQE
ncbi:MAG: MarR family transcriptional regulator [Rubellimicrobium sp.]|nr:MarR family transcriptional regulator [Rubellimicrobium sp.]